MPWYLGSHGWRFLAFQASDSSDKFKFGWNGVHSLVPILLCQDTYVRMGGLMTLVW